MFQFAGTKESFGDPKDLTQKVREALGKKSTTHESEQNSNRKESDDETVKKRDKV